MGELPLAVWADLLEEQGQPTEDLRAWIDCGLSGAGGAQALYGPDPCMAFIEYGANRGSPENAFDPYAGDGNWHYYSFEDDPATDRDMQPPYSAFGRGCHYDFGIGAAHWWHRAYLDQE